MIKTGVTSEGDGLVTKASPAVQITGTNDQGRKEDVAGECSTGTDEFDQVNHGECSLSTTELEEGIYLGNGVVLENVRGKPGELKKKHADLNQVTPEGQIKDAGETVQCKIFCRL